MTIDLSCPAEIFRIDLSGDEDTGCVILLFNLDDRAIDSCEATVRLLDRNGAEKQRTVHRSRALRGRPGSVFRMTVPCGIPDDAVSADVTIDKVWFEDNDVWRRDPARETEYVSNRLPVSRSLSDLQFVAGDSAAGFPSQQEHLWVCVCGRPNSNRSVCCARCRRKKDLIFEKYNQQAVEALVYQKQRQAELKTRSAREDTASLQRAREEEFNARRSVRVRRRTVLVAMLCAIALCGVAVFGVIPGLRLMSGRIGLRDGRLTDADSVLSGLGSFPGAAPLLKECRLRIAEEDADGSEDPDRLAAAAALLRTEPDRENAPALADRADFTRAGLLLESGNADEARGLAESLPEDYPGRTELLNACDYARAETMREAHGYDEARTLFLSLDGYRDAAEQADACLYLSAMKMIEEGEYDRAVSALNGIAAYADSGDQIRRAQYLKGLTLESAFDTDAACEAFRAAGDYEDASQRADAIVYGRASEAMKLEDWARAAELFGGIARYEDAAEKQKTCVMTMAEKAYRDKEYLRADELLLPLPADDPDVSALRQSAIYEEVRVLMRNGEYGFAISLMDRIRGYRNTDDLMKTARYELARMLLDAQDGKGAEEQLTLLGKYKDSEKLLEKARKMQPDAGEDPRSAEEDGGEPSEYMVVDDTGEVTDEEQTLRTDP